MILYFKKNDSYAVMLTKGCKEHDTTSEPGKAKKVKPNIIERKHKSDKQYY